MAAGTHPCANQEYLEKMAQEIIASCTVHRQALEQVQCYLRTTLAVKLASLYDLAPISSETLHSTGIIHLMHIVDEKKRLSDNIRLRSFCEVVSQEMRQFLTREELLIVEKSM